MFIQEATKKAMDRQCFIIRSQIENEYSHCPTRIKPTNTYENCIVYVFYNNEKEAKRHVNWTPSADDLMANDWELYDMGEVEADVHT